MPALDRNGNSLKCQAHVREGAPVKILGPGETTPGGFETVRIMVRCRYCRAEYEALDYKVERSRSVTVHAHDPYEYPREKGVWYRGLPGITTDQARQIQRQNKVLADNTRRTKHGGRHRARIPAALFWAHKKMHGIEYWQDKRNVDRVAKDWGVNNK